MKKVTVNTLRKKKADGEKFACLTAYDALFAGLYGDAGVEVILVGDSLGMVIQGHDTTLPVSMDDVVYHMQCVKRGSKGSLLMADLPFMSYASESQTLDNAARLIRAGAHMVKLEGGAWIAESTRLLLERGIPVCAHMGLTPQSVNSLGGFLVQGRDVAQAEEMLKDALLLEAAGASCLLLEAVPQNLAKTITDALTIPVIGIGAGKDVDGQILVIQDVIGISPIRPPFVKDFLAGSSRGIAGAIADYVAAVRTGAFPGPEHSYD